jgi:putative nucleotidyltransferase with HDIG domain
MSVQRKFIDKIFIYIVLIWTVIVLSVGSFLSYREYKDAVSIAKHEAVVNVRKDLAYRTWVASHGGVYVPITEKTPPNPYLSHIKNRDVNTTDDQQLTLMNPAYTLSQVMSDYTKQFGIKGHITSSVLLNPKNAPDEWEAKALKKVERTKSATYEVVDGDNGKFFRYVNPLVTKPNCLKCHADQGFKVGDIRGGVSVSIPMEKLYKEAFNNSLHISFILFAMWLIGMLLLTFGRKVAIKEMDKKIKNYEQNIFSMVSIIEKRDRYTAGHTQRVAIYSTLIAKEMGYLQKDIDELYRACMLHDIGKISTPDVILLKPGQLSKIERQIIQEHVVTSYDILKQIDIYKEIAEIVRYHHERYDGKGYPYRLKGEDTPLSSQIMTVADAFDAMTTNRIYKARMSVDKALKELEELAGTQFNPEIVKKAVVALKDVKVDININQTPQTDIEKERFAYFYKDSITDLYNREYLEYILAYNDVNEYGLRCIHNISLNGFSNYNKLYGWAKGNELLREVAFELKNIAYDSEYIFRIFGDNFAILNKEHFELEKYLDKIDKLLESKGVSYTHKHYDMKEDQIKDIGDLENVL